MRMDQQDVCKTCAYGGDLGGSMGVEIQEHGSSGSSELSSDIDAGRYWLHHNSVVESHH